MSQSKLSSNGGLEVVELDQAGQIAATYVAQSRSPAEQSGGVYVTVPSTSRSVSKWLMNAFLPAGYPHSVTPDYLEYQIYDSLQAFSSSIAGLISSRAVLEGVGVGDATASPTSALLLGILQDSMGRVATILFAHRLGTSLEPECKMYRLAADIFNDAAMVLDCLSPAFPKVARVALLSASSILRALCGVAAGSAKASLSAHFATQGNLGELNAKDSSQETIISLLGMLAGSFVVSHVTSQVASWVMLLSLLSIHLGTNYLAVRAVTMRTLNRQRANIVFSNYIMPFQNEAIQPGRRDGDIKGEGEVLTPQAVAAQEHIFERDGVLRQQSKITGYAHLGCSLGLVLRQLSKAKTHSITGSYPGTNQMLTSLLSLFADEDYILWYSQGSQNYYIVLKSTADTDTHLKAWLHALLCARSPSLRDFASEQKDEYEDDEQKVLQILKTTLLYTKTIWPTLRTRLEEKGWDLTNGAMETRSGTRIVIEHEKHN